MLTTIAARGFGFSIVLAVSFQLGLLVGMPWGRLAMGGRFPGRLPPALRLASAAQALLLAFFGPVVLVNAGLMWPARGQLSEQLIWPVVVVSLLSLVMNRSWATNQMRPCDRASP